MAQNVTWLAPTSANLGQLQPPIPARFIPIKPPAKLLGEVLNKTMLSQLQAPRASATVA